MIYGQIGKLVRPTVHPKKSFTQRKDETDRNEGSNRKRLHSSQITVPLYFHMNKNLEQKELSHPPLININE